MTTSKSVAILPAMDWALATRRNRDALLGVVAAIAALLGGRDAGPIARGLRNAALALLRPAESAARRLIVIAARGLVVTLGRPRPLILSLSKNGLAGAIGAGRDPAGEGARPPSFQLFDRPKRFAPPRPVVAPRGIPRIRSFGSPALVPWAPPPAKPVAAPAPPPDPQAPVDAARLLLRLAALERALADLPRQARRLARWRARAARDARTFRRPPHAMRPGRPPGWRQRPTREVDVVLRECHALALDALEPDTS